MGKSTLRKCLSVYVHGEDVRGVRSSSSVDVALDGWVYDCGPAISDDDIHFCKALAEFPDDSGDKRDFSDLEPAVQHEILKRAQELKAQHEREKRGRRPMP